MTAVIRDGTDDETRPMIFLATSLPLTPALSRLRERELGQP